MHNEPVKIDQLDYSDLQTMSVAIVHGSAFQTQKSLIDQYVFPQ